jgi:hypothetical protein
LTGLRTRREPVVGTFKVSTPSKELSKQLYDISRDTSDLDNEDLGTKETLLSLDKQILKATKAQASLTKDINILHIDNGELFNRSSRNC